MALNIKNPEVERLAAEVAHLAHESKTEAIRQALIARKAQLSARHRRKRESVQAFLERSIWPTVPKDVLGKTVTKSEREEILGFGPDGV